MIHLQLVTLTGIKFDDDVAEVILPTLDGQIGVLTGHMPLITVATDGVISIRRNSKDQDYKLEHFAAHGGVIEINNNVLRVLVDEADNGDEINEVDAKKAYDLAQKMKKEAKDEVSLENAQKLIDRQSVRLKVAELSRHRRARK
jgi:F-type H+-transporting ATPase subunit epsilon